MKEITLQARDGYALSLAVFESKKAAATIQMVHGMEEHKERYYPFCEFLAQNGFNAVISDLRGHGSSAPVLSHIADENGDALLLSDQRQITDRIAELFPDVPVMLFAHSMGTIITRVLLQTDSRRYARAVLSGYVNPNPAGQAAVVLGNFSLRLRGPRNHSPILNRLALGPYAQSIKNRKTDLDWLSYNEDNVRAYIADPLCGAEFTVASFCALFQLLSQMGRADAYRDVKTDLPILLIAGKDDPCTGGEKGREASRAALAQAGFADISVITYDGMRHEILNETEHQKVYQDLLSFFRS